MAPLDCCSFSGSFHPWISSGGSRLLCVDSWVCFIDSTLKSKISWLEKKKEERKIHSVIQSVNTLPHSETGSLCLSWDSYADQVGFRPIEICQPPLPESWIKDIGYHTRTKTHFLRQALLTVLKCSNK